MPLIATDFQSCTGCGTLGRRRKARWGVACTVGAPGAISGNQRQSAAISRHQSSSVVTCTVGAPSLRAWWQSVVISRHQSSSGVTCTVGAPSLRAWWQSAAISRHQSSSGVTCTVGAPSLRAWWQSVVISRHQSSSGVTCTVGAPSLRAEQREGRVLAPGGGAPVLFRHCDELGHEDVHLMRKAIRGHRRQVGSHWKPLEEMREAIRGHWR